MFIIKIFVIFNLWKLGAFTKQYAPDIWRSKKWRSCTTLFKNGWTLKCLDFSKLAMISISAGFKILTQLLNINSQLSDCLVISLYLLMHSLAIMQNIFSFNIRQLYNATFKDNIAKPYMQPQIFHREETYRYIRILAIKPYRFESWIQDVCS